MNENNGGSTPLLVHQQHQHHFGGGGGAYEPHELPAMNFGAPTVAQTPPNYDAWCHHGYSATAYHEVPATIEATSYGGEISALGYPEISPAKYETIKYEFDNSSAVYQKDQMASSSSTDTMSSSGSVHDDKQSCEGADSSSRMSPDTILMPMVRRGRPTENPCWSYFHRIDDQLVRCRICTKIVKSACATNMTKHLERHHSGDYEKLAEQIRLYRLNDATFRTKIQYLTHMNPPPPQSTQQENVATSSPPIDTYMVPSKIEHYDHQQAATLASPQPNLQQHYYDHSDSTATNPMCIGYNAPPQPQFGEDWQLSHFWPQNEMQPAPYIEQHCHENPIRSEPPTSSTTPVGGQGGRKGGAKSKGGAQWVSSGNERPYMKRNRKTEHPVWEYFKRTGDGNAECTICSGVVKSPCSSNFMRHLMRHHTNEYSDVYMKWVQKRNTTQATSVPSGTRISENYNS